MEGSAETTADRQDDHGTEETEPDHLEPFAYGTGIGDTDWSRRSGWFAGYASNEPGKEKGK